MRVQGCNGCKVSYPSHTCGRRERGVREAAPVAPLHPSGGGQSRLAPTFGGHLVTRARRLLDEADLQANVLELAGHLGRPAFHPVRQPALCRRLAGPDTRAGWPPGLRWAEGERGPTPEQRHWLAALAAVTTVSAHLWQPSDWPAIEEALR